MSHYKSESGGNLPRALCRFVKILPTGPYVTFGSGCIVLQSGPPPRADLITTTQVLTKNDLLGDSSIFLQFEDNQWFELKLKSQDAVNLPDSKPGRVLGHIEGNEDQVSFLRIPVDMFDSRMWPIRKIWPLKKRALSCFYPSDENLETSISNKNITCYVISEDRMNQRFYITEPSYLRFGKDTDEFALLSVTDTDCASPAKTFKDFAKEEKPKGAPLLDAKGRLVGMLAVANSGERKVFPVFLPTLTGDSNTDGPRDEKYSNTDTLPLQNTIPGPDKREQHKEQQQNKSRSSNQSDNGEETSSGEVESNGYTEMVNQNQLHDDPCTSSLPEGNSAPKQNKGQEQDESVSSQRLKTGEESSSEEDPDGESRGKDSMVDSYIPKNVSQNRIPRFASQNSYHGQPSVLGLFLEDKDAPYPKTVSDTTIPKHNPTFPERHSNSYRRMDTVEVSTEKKHLSSEVSDAVLNNIYVMDHLKNHLDTSLRGLKNWRYLAEVNKVSRDKQQRWQLGEYYSQSEKMFETLKAKSPKLSMTSLVTHLQALKINGVKKYIEVHQLQKGSVEEFFDSPNRNHTGKVLLMLDLIDIEQWCSLGIRLGINQESLTQIRTDCVNRQENPGGDVLNIIFTSNATMTIGQFKKKLEKIDRSDIAGKLEKLSGLLTEKSMIGELLEDLDLAREVATMLNNPGIKNYKDLASACGISRETYESLQPPCADSPTQKTIEEIVQRKPKYTVEDLFKDLKDIKRTDVIEVISPYFEEKDVLAWKRKWGITASEQSRK